MTVPANAPTDATLTFNGSATFTIAFRIRSKDDIDVYVNETKRADGTYSVSNIVTTKPESFDLTLSPAPADGDQGLIIQNYTPEREVDFTTSSYLPASVFNQNQDDRTIMIKDMEAIIDKTALKFGPQFLASITDAMQTIPAPTGTETKALVWDGTLDEWTYEINHPGGQTVGEFKTELAQATNPSSSGATLVAYYNGTGAVTVQAQLDLNKTDLATLNGNMNQILVAASSPTASGAVKIPAWDKKTSAASNVQTVLNDILDRLVTIEANIATLTTDLAATVSVEVYATAALAKAASIAAPTSNKIFMSEVGT